MQANREPPMDNLPPLTPRMRRSLERALVIAQENGQEVVGTEHVILAFLDDRSGIAGMTLHAAGIARALRAEIVHIITSEGYRTPSRLVKRSDTE
jgi:ATP-dependent Clp protease ATP-binding subunit ClpC